MWIKVRCGLSYSISCGLSAAPKSEQCPEPGKRPTMTIKIPIPSILINFMINTLLCRYWVLCLGVAERPQEILS